VQLDADLETDLGIDCIDKLVMLSQLQVSLGVTTPFPIRLDQLSTLRHVIDCLSNGIADALPTARMPSPTPSVLTP
jgi:hypothetical protein